MGIGPGSISHLSLKAYKTIIASEVIVGYNTYVKLLGNLIIGKEVITSPMTQEINRANKAIDKALKGKQVCLVSSGDPGIYGMAGVVLEALSPQEQKKIELEIIPGIMAASACASLLGTPLMHDFALISLSDILTEKDLIKKRIELAAQGDFVVIFYNPKSKKRVDLLQDAWRILMKYQPSSVPVGLVRNAHRQGQKIIITELGKLLHHLHKIDMLSTIIVGNSKTYVRGKYMITPRGYHQPANHRYVFP